MTVALSNNPGVAGMTLNLAYDAEALEYKEAKLIGGPAIVGRAENGVVTIALAQPANITGDEAFMTITFTVKEADNVEDTEMTVTAVEAVDIDGAVINPEAGKATVLLTNMVLGDLNRDGKVNIGDAVLMLRLYNGNELDVESAAGDIDGDNDVDLIDIIRMLQFLTGMVSELAPSNNA